MATLGRAIQEVETFRRRERNDVRRKAISLAKIRPRANVLSRIHVDRAAIGTDWSKGSEEGPIIFR